jgi:Tfp pilus assembly protein PilX
MSPMRNINLSSRGRTEAGFIIPTAVIVLFVITVLTGSAIAVAVRSSTSTTRDSSVKAALEASEAGLQVAEFRINQLKPSTTQCISATEQKTSEGECASGSESIGNGASFQYWTTLPLASGAICAGESVVVKSGIVQRCVTSVGKVNGVEPGTRLQARVESAVGEALFSIHGILGLEEVKVSGSVKATAVVASNGLIKGEGSAAFEKGFEICPPTGSFKPAAGTERNKSGVTVGGVGGMQSVPSLEVTRASGCPIEAKIPSVHPTAGENEDIRIANGTDPATTLSWNKPTYTGSPAYELTMGAESKLTLGGEKYYFCKFKAESNGELKIGEGKKVEILIDSHEDNANCPTTSGSFTVEGASKIVNPNGAASLLIMMVGKGPFKIANSGALKANIYAPEAEVILSGAGSLTGAIVGKKVKLEAGSFIYSEEAETIIAGGTNGGDYSRKGWQQCTPSSTEPSKASC